MSDKSINSNFKIEPMSESDIAQVLRIEAENNLSSWGEFGFKNEIDSGQNSILLVARLENSGEVIGFVFARLITPEVEILNTAVFDKYKRKGIGRVLLNRAINLSTAKNCEKCWLEVRESNFQARRFYEKYGFREVGKRKNYYANPIEDAVLLEFNFKN